MAITEKKVRIAECDGCKRTAIDFEGEAPDDWYVGVVLRDNSDKGSAAEWTACAPKCLRKALDNVINPDGSDDED